LEKLPIIFPNEEIERQIETLLENKDYVAIDKLVYELYGLTGEEIRFVEK
jgi:transcriptional/translational regulatory protein YebC/TACO1